MGRDEYFFNAGLDNEEKRAQTSLGEVRWRGAVLFLAGRGETVETLATLGAWDVTVNGESCGPEHGVFRGTIVDLDYDDHWIEADFRLPSNQWSGSVAYCSGANYSRNTAYRIYGAEPTAQGTRIKLGPQSMLLGQGRVHRLEPSLILSDIPHEYARSVVGGNTTRFFDGKLLRSSNGGSTNIETTEFGAPMKLHVDSTDGFNEGDTLYYYDLQKGDSLTILRPWEGRPGEPQSGSQ